MITNKREQFVADIHFRNEMSLVLETIVHILAHTARGQCTVVVVDICKRQPTLVMSITTFNQSSHKTFLLKGTCIHKLIILLMLYVPVYIFIL